MFSWVKRSDKPTLKRKLERTLPRDDSLTQKQKLRDDDYEKARNESSLTEINR